MDVSCRSKRRLWWSSTRFAGETPPFVCRTRTVKFQLGIVCYKSILSSIFKLKSSHEPRVINPRFLGPVQRQYIYASNSTSLLKVTYNEVWSSSKSVLFLCWSLLRTGTANKEITSDGLVSFDSKRAPSPTVNCPETEKMRMRLRSYHSRQRVRINCAKQRQCADILGSVVYRTGVL